MDVIGGTTPDKNDLEERVRRLEADNDQLRSVLRIAGRLLADRELLVAEDVQA